MSDRLALLIFIAGLAAIAVGCGMTAGVGIGVTVAGALAVAVVLADHRGAEGSENH